MISMVYLSTAQAPNTTFALCNFWEEDGKRRLWTESQKRPGSRHSFTPEVRLDEEFSKRLNHQTHLEDL